MKPFPCIIHRPLDCSAGLIVAFHGWGQSASGFRRRSGLDRVAEASRCMIAYPKGRARNWGGISAKKPRQSDVERLIVTLVAVQDRYGRIAAAHLVGFSDGASFALYAASWISVRGRVASVAAYSGLYHDALPAARKYPILLLHNDGEQLVRNVHQEEIRDAYKARGHVVTRVNLPRRRRWFRHHRWRAAEANPIVLKHIRNAMCEPVLTGDDS